MINLKQLKENTAAIDPSPKSTKSRGGNVRIPFEKAERIINDGFCYFIGPGLNKKLINNKTEGIVSDPFLDDPLTNFTEITTDKLYDINVDKNGCLIAKPKDLWIEITKMLRKSYYKDDEDDIFKRKRGKNLEDKIKEKIKRENWSNSRIKRYRRELKLLGLPTKGILPRTGSYVVGGQRNLKDVTEDNFDKCINRVKWDGDIDDLDHILNVKTLYAGDMTYKPINGFLPLLLDIIEEMQRIGVKTKSIITNTYLELEREYEKEEVSKADLIDAYNKCKEIYGKDFDNVIKREHILNWNLHVDFDEFEFSKEFIEKYNNEISLIIDLVSPYINNVENKLGKARLYYKEKITPARFKEIKKTLIKLYLQTPKTMSMLTYDIDFKAGDEGLAKLLFVRELASEFKSILVRNKLEYDGSEKLNHCTLYIPLGDRYETKDVVWLMKLLKLIGINDLKHTYHIGKNMFNTKRFQSYISNSNRTIWDALEDETSIIHELVTEVIYTYYAISGDLEADCIKLYNNDLCISMRDAIEKCFDNVKIIKDNKEKEQRIFFYLDEYEIFRKTVSKYIDNNIIDINLFFHNRSYEHRYEKDERINKKLTFRYYPNKEIINEKETIERIIKEKKYKPVKASKVDEYEILTDNEYDEINWNYNYLLNKIYEIKSKTKLEYIKEDFCELNDERRSNLAYLSFIAGGNVHFKCGTKEWANFVINNIHICNSDKKYTEYIIRQIAMNSFIAGKNKAKEVLKNMKYSDVNRYSSNLKKRVDSIIIDLKSLYDSLYYEEDEKALKRRLTLHRKANPYTDLIFAIRDDQLNHKGKMTEKLIIDFLLRSINLESLSKEEQSKVRTKTKFAVDRAIKFIYEYQEKLIKKSERYKEVIKEDEIKEQRKEWLKIALSKKVLPVLSIDPTLALAPTIPATTSALVAPSL